MSTWFHERVFLCDTVTGGTWWVDRDNGTRQLYRLYIPRFQQGIRHGTSPASAHETVEIRNIPETPFLDACISTRKGATSNSEWWNISGCSSPKWNPPRQCTRATPIHLFRERHAKCGTLPQVLADDTKLYCEVNNMQNAHDLQKNLTALESWTATWQLNCNSEKCEVMHLGTTNSRFTYHMMKEGQQNDLQITELEKDLGIHMDPKLTLSTHCEKKVYVASKTLGRIRRSYTHIDEFSLTKLYISLVRPHLEYGNGALSPVFKKDAILLENVQRRVTKDDTSTKICPIPREAYQTASTQHVLYKSARWYNPGLQTHNWAVQSER